MNNNSRLGFYSSGSADISLVAVFNNKILKSVPLLKLSIDLDRIAGVLKASRSMTTMTTREYHIIVQVHEELTGSIATMAIRNLDLGSVAPNWLTAYSAESCSGWYSGNLSLDFFLSLPQKGNMSIKESQGYKIFEDGTLVNPTPGFEFL